MSATCTAVINPSTPTGTREAAQAECCGNEHPVNLLDWIGA